MVHPVQLSIEAAETASVLPPVIPLSQTSRATAIRETTPIVDTVTLSAKALNSAASSIQPHSISTRVGGFRTQKLIDAALLREFPVQVLFQQGYTSSEIAIDLGLPKEFVDVELGIPTLNAAA